MKKICSLIVLIINIMSLIVVSYGATIKSEQNNIELSYKEAMSEISEDTNKKIETVIIEDKLTTKKFNYYFNKGKNNSLNYIKLESENEHDENTELKTKWKSILKVDNKNKLIVDIIYVTTFPEKASLYNYDFKMGSQGYDMVGDGINGYYNNIYISGLVEFRSKQNYKNYYITHYLYFSY